MIQKLDELLGKTLLVGLTYESSQGMITEQTEYYGTVIGIENDCVVVRPEGQEQCSVLPPLLDAYEKSIPGTYTLRSTGQTVKDPDYTCMFIVKEAEEEK